MTYDRSPLEHSSVLPVLSCQLPWVFCFLWCASEVIFLASLIVLEGQFTLCPWNDSAYQVFWPRLLPPSLSEVTLALLIMLDEIGSFLMLFYAASKHDPLSPLMASLDNDNAPALQNGLNWCCQVQLHWTKSTVRREMHWENPIGVPQSLCLRLFGEPRGPNSVWVDIVVLSLGNSEDAW